MTATMKIRVTGRRIRITAAVVTAVLFLAGAIVARADDRHRTSPIDHQEPAASAAAPQGSRPAGARDRLGAAPSPAASASRGARPSTSSASPSAAPQPGNGQKWCAETPSACGYPDETNTGWRHTGVRLKTVHQDPFTIAKPGTVIDGLDIRGCVQVRARNVTIKRSRIACSNQPMVKNYEPDGNGGLIDVGAGLVVEDVEFDGLNDPDAHGMAFNKYTVRRAYFHNLGAAAKLGSDVHIEDSYVAAISSTESSHNSGFPSDGGVGITLRHNTVLMNSQNGHAVAIYNEIPVGSIVKDVVVDNNLLAGGNYVLYCGAPGKTAPNLRVTNNRFSGIIYAKGGFYGPTANCDGAVLWQNNYWDASREPLMP
ncbi:right-handed parallel beta-helix repeat-containing protein [Micromonospora sp. DT47]|uniref:right-handed parallel beta-helix repeat-containing protein n=1 Tax=Micromonospora sp. DT47 TaxID=3393431 RepID=UPI003CE8E17D